MSTNNDSKDALDLTIDAFLAELELTRIPQVTSGDRAALRKAMHRALVTWAMLHRTTGDGDRVPH
jgi:hypothetical protein